MKRIWTALLLAGLALEAGAQNWQDAFTYADNDYLGTARSLGMGNAMTAVGGDLGSLTFNPAGSAVASYSQFTITPGLGISTVVGQGTLLDDLGGEGFEDRVRTPKTRMRLPNFGAMMVYDTRNTHGLKRISFGLVGNMTKDYTNRLRATGTNSATSYAASLASIADGYYTHALDYWQDASAGWEVITGYRSGLFTEVPNRDDLYYGLTERILESGRRELASPVSQYYGLDRKGYKYDLLMNMGLNFSDRFYLGANIGITTISYREDETHSEAALGNSSRFPTGFDNLRLRYALHDEGSGIYAKVGFIARPFAGLRIGAAIQTPTFMQINESYGYEGYSDSARGTKSDSSPEDRWIFQLTTPLRVDAGIAYTIGKVGLVSADYEFCDYRNTRFSNYDEYDYDFRGVNWDIKDALGPVHSVRLGAELKPIPEMALRVGYNLTTGAQRNWLVDEETLEPLSSQDRIDQLRTAVSFGVGYSSAGSFFADLGVRFQYLPTEYMTPYYYYYYDESDNLKVDWSSLTPEIGVRSSLCHVLLTLGWRF